jgi:hypothetical protein
MQMATGGSGGTAGTGGSGGMAGTGGTGGTGGMAGTGGTGGMAGTGGTGGNPFISHPAASIIEAETHLAVQNNKIVAAWIGEFGGGPSSSGYRVSTDGGQTWLGATPNNVFSPNVGQASDPVVAADSLGNFYLVWIGYLQSGNGSTHDEHIYVAKMAAGSNTFDGTPTGIIDVSNQPSGNNGISMDKPWIVVDANDNIYVTWGELQPGMVVRFNRSTDHGVTWGTPGVVGNTGNLAYPCVDPTSTTSPIYVTYFSFRLGSPVSIAKSTDGVTFGTSATVTTGNVFMDPTCVVRGQNVWVMSDQGTAQQSPAMMPPATSVRVSKSTNGGTSFGTPVTVTNGPSGALYLIPQLNANAAGTLAVTYYEGTEGNPAVFKKALSSDGGATWTVSDISNAGTFTINRAGDAGWFGDYTGLTASGNTFYQVYDWNTLNCPNSTTRLCGHVVFTTF